jgi:hypothetical protein
LLTLLTLLALLALLALLPLLTLLPLLALPLPLLLLLPLLLAATQRQLEVRARALEGRISAQRVLVRADRLIEPLLAHVDVAAVVVGLGAHAGVARAGGLTELVEGLLVERRALGSGAASALPRVAVPSS